MSSLTDRFACIWNQQYAIEAARANNKSIPYHEDCLREKDPNACWRKSMRDAGYRYEERKIGPICLISQDKGVLYRFHVHYNPRPGDFVWHPQIGNFSLANYLKTHRPLLSYDQHTEQIYTSADQPNSHNATLLHALKPSRWDVYPSIAQV